MRGLSVDLYFDAAIGRHDAGTRLLEKEMNLWTESIYYSQVIFFVELIVRSTYSNTVYRGRRQIKKS